MKKILKISDFFFLGFAILALLSCTYPAKTKSKSQGFDPAAIKTIGLLPITYDKAYAPPLPSDLSGTDLSTMIRRQFETQLVQKGYLVKFMDYPEGINTDERFDPLKIEPSILAGSSSSETDGLMQIHVTFHFGIYATERSSEEGPFSQIYLNATGRLIDSSEPSEIWQGTGRARPIQSADFSTRLNYAVYTLAQGVLKTFPDR